MINLLISEVFTVDLVYIGHQVGDVSGASMRNSAHGKGHEVGSLAYAKA